jgi:hypothetical protein
MRGEVIVVRATPIQFQTAATTFRDLATRAQDALNDEDDCKAAAEFRKLLGQRTDDDEWVFPIPDYCNEDGTKKHTQAGLTVVPGKGRYA